MSVDGGSTATYSYDHQNRRIKKVVGSTTTHYVWQGGQVIAEHNGSTGAVITEYIFAGGRMIAREGGGRVFFLYDRLSARATITDGQGGIQGRQSHLPFGEELNATGTTDKHRFTSYERDSETGTDYAVNRQYAQGVGRFNRTDPYRESCNASSPQSLNRYAYTSNDPINRVDPMGLIAFILLDCHAETDVIDMGSDYPEYEVFFTGREACEVKVINIDMLPGGGGGGQQPCQNVDGFNHAINGHSAMDLDNAAITVFGEMAGRFNDRSREEAEAIASVIFNRSTAIANGTAPSNNLWGATSSLSDVVQAPNQFAGFRAGKDIFQSGVDLNEGERNCNRLQTAGSAIAWLASNPGARKPYLYMCAKGHVTTPHSDDVEINGNIFSAQPLGCV